MKSVLVTLTVILSVVANSTTYAAPCSETLKQYIESARNGGTEGLAAADVVAEGSPDDVIAAAQVYLADPSPRVRMASINVLWTLAVTHASSETKRKAVERIAAACLDADKSVIRTAAEGLLVFLPRDFNENCKGFIRQALSGSKPAFGLVILAGVAGLNDQVPILRRLTIDEKQYLADVRAGKASGFLYRTAAWGARLALARLGSREDIGRCLEVVQSETDSVVVATLLHQHLAYIRQPQVIPVLRRYLDSTATVESPVAVGKGGVPLNLYTMDMLSRLIKDFPFPAAGNYAGCRQFSSQDIDEAKRWIDARTTFEFQDFSHYYPRL